MQKVIKRIDDSYNDLKEKDKQRLLPYEFALNNSVDAIYWFTLDAKFIYVNNAACKMLGYSQEEFLSMSLEDMDPQFNRKTAKDSMVEIRDTKDWRLETTQKKKDNSIFLELNPDITKKCFSRPSIMMKKFFVLTQN